MSEPRETAEKSTLQYWLGASGQLFAIVIAVSYISGFIVVNSYLGQFGIKNYDAFKTEYLIAGILFSTVMGLLWIMIGRHVFDLDKAMDVVASYESFKRLVEKSKYWEIIKILFPLMENVSFLVFGSFFISILLFPSHVPTFTNTPLMTLLLFLVFVKFTYQFSSKAEIGASTWLFPLLITAYTLIAALYVFLVEGLILGMFLYCAIAAAVISQYEDTIKFTSSPQSTKLYFGITWLILSAGAFGSYFYGNTVAQLGGAIPPSIRIVINELLAKLFSKRSAMTFDARISASKWLRSPCLRQFFRFTAFPRL